MSSNENDTDTGAVIISIALCIVFFPLLAFVTLILTVIAVFAWNDTRQLGSIIVTPAQARGFIARGIVGAALIPSFLAFAWIFFGWGINWEYIGLFFTVGYVAGSLGIGVLMLVDGASAGAQSRPEITRPMAPVALPRRQPEPFRYASWDDEEIGS